METQRKVRLEAKQAIDCWCIVAALVKDIRVKIAKMASWRWAEGELQATKRARRTADQMLLD